MDGTYGGGSYQRNRMYITTDQTPALEAEASLRCKFLRFFAVPEIWEMRICAIISFRLEFNLKFNFVK